MLLSAVLFDTSQTVTEHSAVVPAGPADSPYVRTKRAAYFEGMARVSRGAEIAFVVPAGIYGPSPFPEGFDRVEVECDGSPARRQAQIHQRSCLPLAPSSGRQPAIRPKPDQLPCRRRDR